MWGYTCRLFIGGVSVVEHLLQKCKVEILNAWIQPIAFA